MVSTIFLERGLQENRQHVNKLIVLISTFYDDLKNGVMGLCDNDGFC